MKTTTLITFLIALLAILFIAKTKISFAPFKITFESPYSAIGYLFLGIGMGFITYQARDDGKKEGLIITKQIVRDVAQDILKSS